MPAKIKARPPRGKPYATVPYPHDDGSVEVASVLYVSDCREFLHKQNQYGVKADLLFADPPFNIGQRYGGSESPFGDNLPPAEYYKFTREWVDLAARALRPGGSMFVHVPDEVAAQVAVYCQQAGLVRANWIILHQEFGQYNAQRFIRSKVHLHYFVKPPMKRRVWNVEDILVPSQRLLSGDKRTETATHGGMRPMLDVWSGPFLGRVQGNNAERWNPKVHPNQLPELYLARIIRCASKPGDVVCDPFLGSGTTAVVANALGRWFIGNDLLPAVMRSAIKRLQRGVVRDVAGTLVPSEESPDLETLPMFPANGEKR